MGLPPRGIKMLVGDFIEKEIYLDFDDFSD